MSPSLATQVAVLIAAMERLEQQFKEDRQERHAAQDATELTRQSVSAELAALRYGHDAALARLDNIEPITNLVTSLRAKVIGGVSVLGVIGAILWGGAVFFKDAFLGWFQ